MDRTEILNKQFKKELEGLLNLHCIENECNMPDFLLAEMIVNIIQAIGSSVKKTLDWNGCDSICHPKHHNLLLDPDGEKQRQASLIGQNARLG